MNYLNKGSVLITGGAGFIGSNLAIGLKHRFPGLHIIALDNLKRFGSESNIPRLQDKGIHFTHGDVRNPEDLNSLPSAPSLIIECSAEPSVMAGYNGSHAYVINSNLAGAVNCFDLARKHRAAVIFLSTSRVYPHEQINKLGFTEADSRFMLDDQQNIAGVSVHGISEQFPIEGKRTLYGATKLSAELMLHEYADLFHIPFIINRCGVVAGPWQMGKVDQGVFTLWMAAHFYKRSLRYIGYGGAGKQVRDVIHVNDLVELIALQSRNLDFYQQQTFNVGGGQENAISLQEVTALCQEISGNTIPIESDPANRPGDVKWYVSDCARLKQATGWQPTATIRTIMTDIWEWIREHEVEMKRYLGN